MSGWCSGGRAAGIRGEKDGEYFTDKKKSLDGVNAMGGGVPGL